jgi:glycosyltransferase involved in cell wall biosynthesis
VKSVQDIRVIQLIDSLEPGGAERMAVTIANTFVNVLPFSGLVVTRLEGSLKDSINSKVDYLFLNKKRTFDFSALSRLRKFVKANKISVVHAHGSSYFFAVLLKLTMPSTKIFWHDHFGNRVQNGKTNFLIKIASYFFSGVFTVNQELQAWATQNLKTNNIHFIPNYIEENAIEKKTTFLKGEEGKRIVLLANLRTPKNHLLAVSAFSKSKIASLGWTLHFIGKDNLDEYSNNLKRKIATENVSDAVFIYGSCTDVQHILNQSNVGLLTSTYEGFPVTLLEYGRANILVICSDVGYCSQIIKNNETGICFESEDEKGLIQVLNEIPNKPFENERLASNLNIFVNQNYSANQVMNKILVAYQKTL